MGYEEKYRLLADELWLPLNKGPLFNDDNEIVEYSGLSSGEGVIYQVCKAIAEPANYSMPRLDDICHRLSEIHQKRIVRVLNDMFFFRC